MKRKILFLIAIFSLVFGFNLVAQELPMIPDDIELGANWNKIADKYKDNTLNVTKLVKIEGIGYLLFPYYIIDIGIKYEHNIYANIIVYTNMPKSRIISIDYTLFYREKDFSSDNKELLEKAFDDLKIKYCKKLGIPAGRRSFVDNKYCALIRNFNTADQSSQIENNKQYSSAYKGIRFFTTERYTDVVFQDLKKKLESGLLNNGFEFIDIIDEENK